METALALLRCCLLSGRTLLQDALCPLEFRAPLHAEILAAAIDEVLNHANTGPDSFR